MHIPFNRSQVEGRGIEYVDDSLKSGQISGDHSFSGKCHRLLEESLGVEKALLMTSCTHALEASALLLDITPGDEVIVPSFTFVSTVNSFVLRGAKPVFCDVRPDTLNMDEKILPELITERTRAILPVHYAGVGCEMDSICEVASKNEIPVVEDNAHGLFGKYRGKWLGTFGCLATQSFHETKNITCGEGGALLINEPKYAERAEILREKGTNRSKFFRGQVDKYSWVDLGSSYLLSDILAALLYGQLEVWKTTQQKRQTIWERYNRELKDWALKNGVSRPFVPEHCEQAWHMYYLLFPDEQGRDQFIAFLTSLGISAVFHYLSLHSSPMGKRLGGEDFECPVTESVSSRIVRLPFYTSMAREEQDCVIEAVLSFKLN